MAKILITGAGGFIGRALARHLVDSGDEVVCLHRVDAEKPHSVDRPQTPKLDNTAQDGSTPTPKIIWGDVRSASDMAQAMEGVNWVFHLAAVVATRSLEQSRSVNVEGTKVVARAAANCPTPPRFVYVSSLATAGPRQSPSVESDPCNPISVYGRTKLEAEQALREFANDLPVTIVRPPCVFGPDDRNMLNLYQTVHRGWNPMISATDRYSFVHVDDLVRALRASAEHGRCLRGGAVDDEGVYYLSDPQAVNFIELAEMIAKSLGVEKVRHFVAPKIVCWGLGALGELAIRLTGRKIFINLDKVREGVAGSWVCDPSRAQADLDFRLPFSLQERIDQTTQAYRTAGWIDQ